jgi:hypothetical protein
MQIFQFFQFFLVLIVPGLIGAIAYSIAHSLRTQANIVVALILDLVTFTTMIAGLYWFKHVFTVGDLLAEFDCLSFTRNYICLSTLICVAYGVLFGLLRRCFFWIRH